MVGGRTVSGQRDVVIREVVVDSSVVATDSTKNIVWTRRAAPTLYQR
jgi:hypothetical protein